MYVVTWDELNEQADRIADRWRGQVHSVYGVPTGGVPVALLVAQRLNVPVVAEYVLGVGTLVVDDLVDTGRTLDRYSTSSMIDAAFRKPHSPHKYAPHAKTINEWLWFPWEHDEGDPHDAVVRLIQFIGDDPTREGLLETPKRVCKAWLELTSGYRMDPAEILSKQFEVAHDDLIVLSGVDYWSTCEHHMLPFYGQVTLGYIPRKGDRVVGLSKLARLVECYSRRLQVQERMTNEIANALRDHLDTVGVGVIVTGHHTCMNARGVRSGGTMTTSTMFGAMRHKPEARSEFVALSHVGRV